MGPFLLDQLVEPMRKFAINAILRAYRPPSLPLPFVAEQLGFAGDDAHARVAKFASYVPCGCVLMQWTLTDDCIYPSRKHTNRTLNCALAVPHREHGMMVNVSGECLEFRQ
jgi:hypothetical protein